jgi:hypothetical protein
MKTGSAVGADVDPASNRDPFQNIVGTPSAMSMATTRDEIRPSGLMAFDQPWRTRSGRPWALDGLRSGC